MERTLFSYSGQFTWWAYTVYGRKLLLRSTRSSDRPSQLDVMFENVHALHLPFSFFDLEVLESDQYPHDGMAPIVEDGAKMFIIRGKNFEGYVIADVVVQHEDNPKYNDQSPFWPFGSN